MYGFVHTALYDLVVGNFGEEKWKAILAKAGVELGGGSYLIHKIYEDKETLSLILAACEVLGVGLNDVLEKFGEHFFHYCVEAGYDRILRVLGRNLKDFLCNLDSLHDHLASIYPGMEAPSFRCSETQDGTLLLHYYSKRSGLEYIVIGLVKVVARELLKTTVVVEILREKNEENDHVLFALREKGDGHHLGVAHDAREMNRVEKGREIARSSTLRDTKAAMTVKTFSKAFPFHIMFDRDLIITQAGDSIQRILHKNKKTAPLVFIELFTPTRPRMDKFDFDSIISHINATFIITTKDSLKCLKDEKSKLNLRLKGQMLFIPESDSLLFLCSPRVASLDALRDKGVYLSDIPTYDATRDLLFMSHARRAERELVEQLEETTNNLKKLENRLIEDKKRTDELLHSILPKNVAEKLRLNEPVDAENYVLVSILFSDIVGFTALCSSENVVPMDIVRMLNKLYTYFDMLSTMNDVYKVETIGDAYMVVGGLPVPADDHAQRTVQMAIGMIEASTKVISPSDNQPIKIRVGIHSGSVMAGVVGKKMPRYCLFGSTVTIANKLESGSQSGRINVSLDTRRYLGEDDFVFEPNEGNHPVTCFFLKPHPSSPRKPSILDIASSTHPSSLCGIFRSPQGTPLHGTPRASRASSFIASSPPLSSPPCSPPSRRKHGAPVITMEKMEFELNEENGFV